MVIKLKIKNLVRLLIGIMSLLLQKPKESFYLYINLLGKNKVGGPDRFLNNIKDNLNNGIIIENWKLGKCNSALVFSASWGDSFTTICRLKNIKSVLRVDGFYVPDDSLDPSYQLDQHYQKFVNNRLKRDLELFDHVIYQSNFSKEICDQHLFYRKTDFSIINNGVDLNLFRPCLSSNHKIELISVAKHYPKHLLLLVEIIKCLPNPSKYSIKIVGPMRDGQDKVESYIRSLHLPSEISNSIQCLGVKTRSELSEILNQSDIFLHLKVGDWCPNAALEAMASGVPVICPSWGGTGELVGDAGIICQSKPWATDKELALRMAEAILKMEKDLIQFKIKARKRAEKHFNIDIIAEKYLKVLK